MRGKAGKSSGIGKRGAVLAGLCCLAAALTMGCAGGPKEGMVKEFAGDDTITLSFFGNDTSSSAWSQPFTAADGTQVQVMEDVSLYYGSEGGGDFRDLLRSRLQDDPGSVDFYTIAAEDVIAYDKAGYWDDLSALGCLENLSQDALEQSTYDGKVFSVPLSYTGFGFYWNVDLLREHGLAVPENLEEFLAVCETLKHAGITPYLGNKGYALTVVAMAVGFADLYASDEPAKLLDDLSSGKTPVSSYMDKGFAFVEMMVEKGYLDAEYSLATVPTEGDKEDFLAGKGAFYCTGLGTAPTEAPFEMQGTALPVLEGGSVAVVGANNRIAVNPRSEQVAHAREALEYLCAPERLASIARDSGEMSALAEGADDDHLGAHCSDLVATIKGGNQVPNQDFRLHFNTWISIRDLCRDILAGESAPAAAERYDAMQAADIETYE